MNLADFVLGWITNPQEEFLENRVGMRPLPQGHKDSHPGLCLPVFIKALSPGLTLSGLRFALREGSYRWLAMIWGMRQE